MSLLQSLELDKQWLGERMEKVGRSLKILQGIIRKEAEAYLFHLEGKQEPLPGFWGGPQACLPSFLAICQAYSPKQS